MIQEFIASISVLLIAVILHECAHGWVAYRLGDPTAKLAGRLTLNPLKHIDPIGSILLPLVLRLMHFYPFGWAKPVPVNFASLNNPKRDMVLVALAGPAVNFMLAVFLSLVLKLNLPIAIEELVVLAILINLILAIFNLIPIPPLDGSRLVMGLLPNSLAILYSRLERYGIIIVLVMLNLGYLDFIWPLAAHLAQELGAETSLLGV